MFRTLLFLALIPLCYCHTADTSKWERFLCDDNGQFEVAADEAAPLKACEEAECVFKCQAEVLGWVNEDGTHTVDILEEYAREYSPPEYLDKALEYIQHCYAQYGDKVMDFENCDDTKDYAECLDSVLPLLKCDPQRSS